MYNINVCAKRKFSKEESMNTTSKQEQKTVQIAVAPKKTSRFYLFIKRSFDIVTSLIAMIVLSPVFLILSVIIKLEDGGSVFYLHQRIGKNGKPFKIHKFRSMVKNSQDLKSLLTPEQLEQYQKEFKIDNDPRITKVGKFLRTTSLDELPQLWDIFTGKISLIGPRPLVKDEIDLYYSDNKELFLSCKPGLTGYWQAYARNHATYESGKRQEMELFYITHRSFLLDIKILFQTVVSVISKKGAK